MITLQHIDAYIHKLRRTMQGPALDKQMGRHPPKRLNEARKVVKDFVYASDLNTVWMSKKVLVDWIVADCKEIGAI